jgi:hypothetical protein
MITVAVCMCGTSYEAAELALLTPTARFVEDGQERQRVRCACGRRLEVTILEYDTCREIEVERRETRNAYSRARLECAMLRAAKAQSFKLRWQSFRLVRAEARMHRDRAQLLESMLVGIYRARELVSPKQRLGRNLVVVDGDAVAKTERPRAAR